jgi:hypothetical protein
MKLTKRGVIVRNLFISVLLVVVFVAVDNATTPDKCKVDVSQMSQGCKDLLYP